MSDLFEDITKESKATKKKCRVAYTINNSQPVACTIIGEQPLFYMDFEGSFEEEGLFDGADLDILESELMNLQNEIESFDRFSEGFADTDHQKIEKFLEDADIMTSSKSLESKSDINVLIEALKTSRLAQAYIECANEYSVEITYDAHVEHAVYDRKNGKILINDALSHADQLMVAARELRRHFQHRQGALIHPLMFHPDNAILVNRAQICDLVVSMIRIAWELQLGGTKQAWERVENSSLADLGRAFAREAYLDFRTVNNGSAAAAVFEAWFLSERCRGQDKVLIQQMLTDYQGYVFDLEEATQNITPTLIAALGEMPFGKNYLAEHAVTIMNDPVFSDIRDRSNANFLWFIKFERSFRESEDALMTQMPKSVDADTAQETSAEIITLFDASENEVSGDNSNKSTKRLSPKADPARIQNKSADIVYLRRWSGE